MSTLRKSTLVMLLIAAVLMAGCKKETEPENNGNSDNNNENTETVGHKNPNPAQDTPLSETVLSEFKSVYQLCPNADGSFYALAMGQNTDYLVKLDNNGYVQQRVELGFESRRCLIKSGENIVLVGNLGKTTSPYTMYERGCVVVYDHTMQLTATTILKESQYNIQINTIIQDTQDHDVFYAGGLAIDESYIQYPYLCTLRFSEGLMTKVSSKIYTDYPKYRVLGMVEKNLAGQNDLILETLYYWNVDNPEDSQNTEAHIVKLNYFEEESGWGHEIWDVAVLGQHHDSYADNNSIISDESNVYFFGRFQDDKTPAPSSGYWNSGCVAAIDWYEGRMKWFKSIALSNKSDLLCVGQLSEGCFYICGRHSGLHYNTTKKYFGNGLVVMLSLSGNLLSYKTFGDPERQACFNHIVKDINGNWVVVGWFGENLGNNNRKYSGWFLKTDMLSGGSSKAMSIVAKDELFDDMDAGSTSVPMDGEIRCGGM